MKNKIRIVKVIRAIFCDPPGPAYIEVLAQRKEGTNAKEVTVEIDFSQFMIIAAAVFAQLTAAADRKNGFVNSFKEVFKCKS